MKLKLTEFKKLFLAQIISSFGDWIVAVVAPVALMRVGMSGTWASVLVISKFLPGMVLPWVRAWISAWWAARVGAGSGAVGISPLGRLAKLKSTLLWSDGARAVIFLLFLVVETPLQICLLTLVMSIGNALFNPARAALLPSLVKEEELVRSNALMASAAQAMILLGPALGGMIVGLLSEKVAIVLNSVSFLVSFGLIAWVKLGGGELASQAREATSPGESPTETVEPASDSQAPLPFEVKKFLWSEFISTLAFGSLNVFFQLKAFQVLKLEPQGFGLMMSALGGGLLCGSLLVTKLAQAFPETKLYGVGLLFGGLGLLPFAAAHTLFWSALSLFFVGLFNSIQDVSVVTLLQKAAARVEVPVEKVFEISQSMISLAVVLGTALCGLALEGWSVGVVLAGLSLLPMLALGVSGRERGVSALSGANAEADLDSVSGGGHLGLGAGGVRLLC